MFTALSIKNHMQSPVLGVSVDADLEMARTLLDYYGISCLAVRDRDERVVGAISRTDLLRAGGLHWRSERTEPLLRLPQKKIAEIMRSPVISVTLEQTLLHAASQMVNHRVHRVFVVDGVKAVGVCSTLEVMQALVDAPVDARVRDYMSTDVVSVMASDPVSAALERLREAQIGGVVVVGDHGWPLGVFTNIEALAARSASADTRVDALMQTHVIAVQATVSITQAAQQAAATKARRVLVFDRGRLAGVLSSLDFARALVAIGGREEESTPAARFAMHALYARSA